MVTTSPGSSPYTSGVCGPTNVEKAVPIYEYVCMECESHFEELVRMDDTGTSCPDCGTSNVKKQLSVFAAHGTAAQLGFGGGGGGCCGGSCGCN